MKNNPSLILYMEDNKFTEKAKELSEKLGLNVCMSGTLSERPEHFLRYSNSGLELVSDQMVMKGDFSALIPRINANNLNRELLVRAAGYKTFDKKYSDHTPSVLDATAGMGEDSFLLAAAGFHVILYERNPVIAALLEDALERGRKEPTIAPVIQRMKLRKEDSITALKQMHDFQDGSPDIVYLDPMFPKRQKSGLVKKKFQLLHILEEPCMEEEDLLQAAMDSGAEKIIVKRPLKSGFLGNRKPSYSLSGKAIRYDCIVMNARC